MTDGSSAEPSPEVVVVEFSVTDRTYPFVALSADEDCRVALEQLLPRGPGRFAEFFSVDGADADRVLALAEEADEVDPRLVERYDDGGLFEFVVDGFCPARDLAQRGAIPTTVRSDGGEGTIVAEIPCSRPAARVVGEFLEAHPGITLVAKRSADRLTPRFSRSQLQRAVGERLTERQREVLLTAFDEGYYDRGKGPTLERVGEVLGISASTVSQHLKAAERGLVAVLLEDERTEERRREAVVGDDWPRSELPDAEPGPSMGGRDDPPTAE